MHAGFEVRVFVRDEAKIPEHLRGKVEAVVGDVTNSEQVSHAVAGQEGVVVVLGTRNDLSERILNNIIFLKHFHGKNFAIFIFYSTEPTTVMSDGIKNIIQAMKTHGVRPLSVCLSGKLII